ncbi:hypothetical protein V6N13_014914 [Hibiscus sabdariffa]
MLLWHPLPLSACNPLLHKQWLTSKQEEEPITFSPSILTEVVCEVDKLKYGASCSSNMLVPRNSRYSRLMMLNMNSASKSRCSNQLSRRKERNFSSSSSNGRTPEAEEAFSFSFSFSVPTMLNFIEQWSQSQIVKMVGLLACAYLVIPSAAAVDALKTCTCLLKECRVELAKCIANPSCAANVACLQTCNNRPDETECQIKCGDLFENSVVDEFNECAVSRKKCVPQKSDLGEFPAPDPAVLVENFSIADFSGKWFISSGLNPTFDTFNCQLHEFHTEGGKLVGNLSWRIETPDGGFFTRSTTQRFVQDPNYPGILYNHDNEYLHYQDDWYIISSKIENKPDDYVFVYYRGRNDAWDGYGGAVIYTRSAVLPETIVPELERAARKVGRNFNTFIKTDNTCGPEPPLVERLEKKVEEGEQTLIREVKEIEGEVEKEVEMVGKTEQSLFQRLFEGFKLLQQDEENFLRGLSKEEVELFNELKMEASEVEKLFGDALPIRKLRKFSNPEKLEDLESLPPSSGNAKIRYRIPSSADLHESFNNGAPTSPTGNGTTDHLEKMKRPMARHDPVSDKIHRYRGVLLVISIPILLVMFVLYVMPGRSAQDATVLEEIELNSRKIGANSRGSRSYAVIFDAGSSGSRVHVYCFDRNLDLVPIGSELELFEQLKPGLSYYAKDPQAAANSLLSLLDKAESVVPLELRSKTPVRVGATAGLRALEGDASDRILQAVRELLKDRSTLKSEANGVKILDGSQEGSYEWVTINYLLGKLGGTYKDTVGIIDLGGGSVQMAYAISQDAASKAPGVPAGEDNYVNEMYLKGSKYYLYVHSYLSYGLLAARAEILKASDDSGNPCILEGFDGNYAYGGKEYKASAPSSGTSMEECRRVTLNALKINDTCTHMKCTFGGIWNGGGGDGQKNMFIASFFFDRAAEAGFIKAADPVAKVTPHSFAEAAKRACGTKYVDAKATFPDVGEGNLAYICMDLVYQYTLLIDGFGLDPYQDITLVKKVQYRNSYVEAAWPLGSAIEAVSS